METDRRCHAGFLQEDREWALKRGLDEINKEIEAASRADVACWFPMGTRDERIVRLAGKEAQLLNSRQDIASPLGGLSSQQGGPSIWVAMSTWVPGDGAAEDWSP